VPFPRDRFERIASGQFGGPFAVTLYNGGIKVGG
jgi:hypothetical protein